MRDRVAELTGSAPCLAKATAPALAQPQQQPAHLLVIDDDAPSRRMAVETLLHAGFKVSDSATGEDALERISADSYDLVLLDVMMPGIDGYEVCRRIRSMKHRAALPIILLTGLKDTASIELALAHGATDFITKPINWTLLSYRVRYALRAARANDEMQRSRDRGFFNSPTLFRASSQPPRIADADSSPAWHCRAPVRRIPGA